jgi:NADH-quinone oxidoreductase subunit N
MNAIVLSALWGVVMMYTGVLSGRPAVARAMALIGIALLIVASALDLMGMTLIQVPTTGMLEFSTYGHLFVTVLLVCTALYLILSLDSIESSVGHLADHCALIFFSLAGICVTVAFKSLLMLFLGIEIMTIPMYILAASDKRNLKSNEAGLKYFLMGAFSTGLMLMGITLLYGAYGTFVNEGMNLGMGFLSPLAVAGIVLLMVSMAFKVSAAPFHFWTPDVYDGTPTVFTSFMASIVKAAAFYAFLRLFDSAFGKVQGQWQTLVALLTAATLLLGNVTAVFQQSVKRMLAYSSIAQAGFMLMAVFALNITGKQGLLLYAAAYSLATIGIFAVLTRMKDFTYEGFNGLARHEPMVAGLLTVFLLSLTGIPLTAGFFAKYHMILAVLRQDGKTWLAILAVLCAAVSVFYYFKVIQAMYFKEGPDPALRLSKPFLGALAVAALLIVMLGIHPDWLLNFMNL